MPESAGKTKKLAVYILIVGVVCRTAQFIYNRSLTEGEAALALNIIQRSYGQLLKPLDFVQAAPVGFLLIQKFINNILGAHEYGLRLLPFIAGISALFIFYAVIKKIVDQQAAMIGLVLFAVNDQLIYFASEVKQYSTDVFITLVLVLLAVLVFKKKYAFKYLFAFGLASGIALWFSHPALFTSAAGFIIFYLYVVAKRDYHKLPGIVLATLLCVISFMVNYLFILNPLSKNSELMSFWQMSFMPLPPRSIADLRWFIYVFLRTFKFPGGLSPYELFLAVLAFFWGSYLLFRHKRKYLLLLILPIGLALLASGLHRYPFEGRLLLFLTPLMVIIIAAGIDDISRRMKYRSNFLSYALIFILLVQPVFTAGYRLIRPRAPEELRTILDYVGEKWQDGDIMYIYYASLNAFLYYRDRYDFQEYYVTGVESRSNWSGYYADLLRLKGNKRVWLVFSHITTWHGVDEERLFESYLDLMGKQLTKYKAPGSAAYLYDLSSDQDAVQ